jgi:tetratricopeptide (TPR) repeat protein
MIPAVRRLAAVAVLIATSADAIDLDSMWDFSQPTVSEERFRAALKSASGDEVLILQTQIARTYMLRGDFDTARGLLAGTQASAQAAGPEARARYWLETGRSYASHRHPPGSQTAATRQLARDAYIRALAIAKGANLDAVAIDVLHMLPFVDTDPAQQLEWNRQALAMVEVSGQEQARRWEPSIRSNLGESLYDLGRYEEALEQFRQSAAIFEQRPDAHSARDGYWHVAHALRALNRNSEALAIQLRLERECDAAGAPRAYIFEELEILFRAAGNEERARYYAGRIRSLQ